MIPKIIHYCWFGGNPLPPLAVKCLESWKQFLPDYQIIEWNEKNFPIDDFIFAKQALENRKFAFISDVCRLYALKEMGGIYLDTDVEFIKPLSDEILDKKAFTGFEGNFLLSSAIMGSEKDGKWINDLLAHYQDRSFYLPDGRLDVNPNTEIITAFMKETKGLAIDNSFHNIEAYCSVYPSDFFSPKSWKTLKINLTKNTYCIHHFAGSWLHEEHSVLGKMANALFGPRLANHFSGIYRKLKGTT